MCAVLIAPGDLKRAKVRLSGHQTFPLRYGWLEKGFEYLRSGKLFSDPDAVVQLGVGKNMVDSIKYWCEVTGIVVSGKISRFADLLLDPEHGWDPYLEDPASWWILHWRLVTNPWFKTTAVALFSHIRRSEFSKSEVAEAVIQLVDKERKPPSDKVIMRDVECYLKAYCGSQRLDKKRQGDRLEECPFQELGIIQPVHDTSRYRFSMGAKPSLTAEVIGYALGDYFLRCEKQVMSLQSVLYGELSPGQVFMLNENVLVNAVEELQRHPICGAEFGFIESGGIAQVKCTVAFDQIQQLLKLYYSGGGIDADCRADC